MAKRKMPQYAKRALRRLIPLATPLHAAHAQVAAHEAAHAPRLVTTNMLAGTKPSFHQPSPASAPRIEVAVPSAARGALQLLPES